MGRAACIAALGDVDVLDCTGVRGPPTSVDGPFRVNECLHQARARQVTRGLISLIKISPRPGWARGDQAMTPETRAEIAELEAKIAQFE